jgi:ribosomal protein S18
MIAPIGTSSAAGWHPYTLLWLYKIGSMLNKQTTLMQSAAYFPVVFIFLSLIFAFLIAYRISGPVGGVSAATMLAILPAIMGRTPWGHADTDAYNVFFAVLVVWLLFEALSSKSAKKQLLFGGLTGLAFGVYANFWSSWWYLFDFVGAALAVAIVADIVIENKLLREGLHKFWAHSQTKKFIFTGLMVLIVVICIEGLSRLSYFDTYRLGYDVTEKKNFAKYSHYKLSDEFALWWDQEIIHPYLGFVIDFKDEKKLLKFMTEQGKVIPRRISGNCGKHQRELVTAIKRARHLALIPFVADATR